tara:strand:+ start:1288 stop:1482 length:195 start_codon:yes stop_codon:yes gene_type:complete
MIKVGDKVTLWENINKVGIVLEVFHKPVNTWFVGGTAGTKSIAKVQFEDETVEEVAVDRLMRVA